MTVKLTPYLNMEGNAREAIRFYEQALDAEVLSIITYGDMPEMPNTYTDALNQLVAHAKLRIGEAELMFSDAPTGTSIPKGKQVTICISTNSVETSKRFFEALEQEGQVNMPFEEAPFSPGFGDVTDKFGVTFQIYTED
ncbi:VOC family protein [Paenibacillus lautus]|uniref:VOC family protein n=1 Tax=Bacillales TaxID=1385 RepID=UPI0003E25590|nr:MULTISPECIES: VOC family protein [Paenibacillus]ETT66990.1 3-demethylubiquinone-9 3-methyltransferase [Paenibacillus sp. FSL H8-457]PCL93384.1 VOC family protein [Paenibacillus lautus]QOT12016.1 VOC family protein [Paenibacillus sp. JNUCC-32]WFB55900.1 VOC family protein [Paenibacillus sp. BR1-192]GIP03490.1 VOC family protein [Paenibacillus lautus]